MDLQNIVFLGFVGGWLGGLAWASIVSIKSNETKKENEAMKKTNPATKRCVDRNVEP